MKHSLNLFVLLALLVVAPSSFAQASRTWVSGVGDDANPCSRTAPCKTFAGAISKTASGGEIDALDPAGFGALTITKPITIDGGGGIVASVLVSGTNGIVIQATGQVILRNLAFNGIGSGINGIRVLGASSVLIDHCTIEGFTTRGIDLSAAANTLVTVRDTVITATPTGVGVSNTAANGVLTLLNSTISNASTAAVTTTTAFSVVNVESSTLTNNPGTALLPTAGVIRVSNTDVYNNGAGTGAGTIGSAGNNRKAGNGSGATDPTVTTF